MSDSVPAKRRILIVDDDNAFCDVMSAFLTGQGFDARTASGAEDALESIEESMPDAFIIDLMMPKVSGMDLITHLRNKASTSKIPIIVLTARASTADPIRCREAGADYFAHKPFEMSTLREKLDELLS